MSRSRTVIAAISIGIVLVVMASEPAAAQTAPNITNVVDNLRNWIAGLLAALATLFLTVGGLRYMLAGGDPGQIERAKTSLRSAAIGYALAALAPILVQILRSVVGA